MLKTSAEVAVITPRPPSPASSNWALVKTGFQAARAILDARNDPDPGPIAVVDVGKGALGNPRFTTADVTVSPQQIGTQSALAPEATGVHAAEVAGLISLACPEARLVIYNVATKKGIDRETFIATLQDILTRVPRPRVVNISLGWLDDDPAVKKAITELVAEGVVVVAAMGELEEPNDFDSYPAAYEGVIAVGATDRFDLRLPLSSVGNHIWIAAPGEDIETVVTDTDMGVRSGTSFATALVSAAAWLAVRAIAPVTSENAVVDQVKLLLGESADAAQVLPGKPNAPRVGPPNGRWNMAVGCGRLEVGNMATLITTPGVRTYP